MDFSANINPLGPSPKALQAIGASLENIVHYPDPDCVELREELSRHLQVDPDCLVVGNGAVEIIHLLTNIAKPRTALVLAPTFSEYEVAVKEVGGSVARIPLSKKQDGGGFTLGLSDIEAHLDCKAIDMIFLCNPNNPTGNIVRRDAVEQLLDISDERDVTVIVDESFMDFVDNPEMYSVRQEVSTRRKLAIIGSLTKFFALPGLRVGYSITQPGVARELRLRQQMWSVNCLAQIAAVASLRDQEYIDFTRAYVEVERAFFMDGLRDLGKRFGIRAFPSAANFILLDLEISGMTARKAGEALAPRGILVRDCSDFPFLNEYHMRIAVRTRAENECLLRAVSEVLGR